jgi:hypothetical protein
MPVFQYDVYATPTVIPAKAGTHRPSEDGYDPPLSISASWTGPLGPRFRGDDDRGEAGTQKQSFSFNVIILILAPMSKGWDPAKACFQEVSLVGSSLRWNDGRCVTIWRTWLRIARARSSPVSAGRC